MVFLKKISALIVISVLFASCDDVVMIDLNSEYTKIDFVKCESNKSIIVKTDKFCGSNLSFYMRVFYKNEIGRDEYIKIKGYDQLNSNRTKFRLYLNEALEPGIKYKTYAEHKYLICYFDFEYTE